VRAGGERLVLACPRASRSARPRTPDNRELLMAIIARTTGDAPDLQFVLEQGPAAPAAPRAEPERRPHHRPSASPSPNASSAPASYPNDD